MAFNKLAVIGAGAWGTALAQTMVRAGRSVTLWAREPEVVAEINAQHRNTPFLPDIALSDTIRATGDMADAVAGADAVILVVPSPFLRATCRELAPALPARAPLIICSKGIEAETGALMSEIVGEELPDHPVAVLSGPTFAAEVARGLPTAITFAMAEAPAEPEQLADSAPAELLLAVSSPTFRPYLSTDVIGAEIGGAVKNVIAIACGIADGMELGSNARAALITRGLAEITRFGVAKGASPETLMGLSGLGDLTLTCNSTQSRNFSFGRALGQGRTVEAIMAGRRVVVEGVHNAASVSAAALAIGVQMPICDAVNAVLHKGVTVDNAIKALLDRPLRGEGPSLDPVVIGRSSAA